MSQGRRVKWTDDIESNLGVERLESLEVSITDYTCIVCGELGVTDLAPASILLYVSEDHDSAPIEFAHQTCSAPQIVTVTGSLPSQPPAEGPQLWMSSWLIREPRGEKIRATIVLDSESNVELIDEPLGRIDTVLATLLDLGWEQIHALDSRYVALESCEVVLLPGRAGYLNVPGDSGGVVVPALPVIDPVWIAIAHRNQSVDVLACRMNMREVPPAHRESALVAEIRTGLVLAARLPLAAPNPAG